MSNKPRKTEYFSSLANLFGVVLWLSTGAVAIAGEWSTSSSLSASTVFADNSRLESLEVEEQSDTFLVVTPAFSITGEGRRATLDLDAKLQFNTIGGEADKFNPEIRGNANIETVEDILYVDIEAGADQRTINPFGRIGRNGTFNTDNQTTRYSYRVSPYIVRHLANFATLNIRYDYDDQINEDREAEDSERNSASISLSSGSEFQRLIWTLSGSYSDVDYSGSSIGGFGGGADNERNSARLRLDYIMSRKLKLTSYIGYDWNDFRSAGGNQDGEAWDLGFDWTPSARTRLSAGYTDRPVTQGPRFNFSHRSRRVDFRLGYSEQLRDTRELNGGNGSIIDQGGVGIPRDPLIIDEDLTFREPGIFREKRFEGAVRIQGVRTNISLSGSRSEQSRELDDRDATFNRASVSLSRSLSPRTRANASLTWHDREDDDGQNFEDLWTGIGLSRQLGLRLSLFLNYSFSTRESDLENDDYDDNRVSFGFNYIFR